MTAWIRSYAGAQTRRPADKPSTDATSVGIKYESCDVRSQRRTPIEILPVTAAEKAAAPTTAYLLQRYARATMA